MTAMQTARPSPDAPEPPIVHPMDPRRGQSLSPMFAAVLCHLLGLPAMTRPAIAGIRADGGCVFAATDADPFFNTLIGSWRDLERNIRGWGEACGADAAIADRLIAKARERTV